MILPCRTAQSEQANVFIYHRFNDFRYPSTNTSNEDFRAHLKILRDGGYQVLTLGKVVDSLQAGRPLPERCAVISVDDAYRSFLTGAWPLLQEFGYPATLFVNTDAIGGHDFMTWKELKTLHDAGLEIGNHSASHAYMLDRWLNESDQGWEQRINDDLERSNQAFLDHLGFVPELFAYPYGEFSLQLKAIVKSSNFRAAFGQQSGVIVSGLDLFTLPRFPVSSVEEFRSKLTMKHLPVKTDVLQDTVVKEENPPTLKFFLDLNGLNEASLRCYSTGGLVCRVGATGEAGVFVAKADSPITKRRSKYTITASDSSGRQWYWFSQLWVLPQTADDR